ncbi:MAG: hypothetical protein LPJ89_02015 [Hymenobacteraceae bacterium]|nr:hypothetical protein [Hymenobacteraceae bacterium]MDX5397280.1 hypothetical protein [Hymenobacteraceae bacterium]MDX5442539.1 hypothetical protein [Hymenobacteraceae bacterium]MDX5513358.1 hypothetical protein [Hymenobacteraceae bacterium]
MKKVAVLCKSMLLVFFAAGVMSSCSESEEQRAEREYSEFRTWVNEQESKVEQNTEQEWAEVQREYETRTTEMDKAAENLSSESRKEYEETKVKFLDWNNRNKQYAEIKRQQQQDSLTRAGATDTTNWDNKLLGKYSDLNSVTAATLADAYQQFMSNVKANQANWTDAEWDKADAVFNKLDRRKDELTKEMSEKQRKEVYDLFMGYKALEVRKQ